jgi:hypothetical protein
MNFAQKIDFSFLMEPVALRLLGQPTQKRGNEWRYGARGSLAIDIKKGTWFDHEANRGGGVVELIRRRQYGDPLVWLRSAGLLDPSGNQPKPPPQLDSQPEPPQLDSQPKPKIVETYDYRDETGKLLFQVVRYDPKDFKQRRPDGRGGWIWNLQDTRRVPYLLPELMKAVAAGQTIYIPEGEKDVETFRAFGLAATTNPCGIKKWLAEYSEYLRGADVVVLPDNHAKGREHGEQVVAFLRGVAKCIRVLDIGKHWADCPDKGDISDWRDAGGTAEKLKAIEETLPDVSAPADNPNPGAPSIAPPLPEPTWPTMDSAAYHGLPGDVVRAIEPHTEADQVAILIQFLALAGNTMGRTAYYLVEDDRHHTNLFAVLVGESSKARKGTSLGRVRAIMKEADQGWSDDRLKGGLSSGEGLINEVRDERKEWNKKEGREEVVDVGVKDKRLMVVEPEFASALAVMERAGNTLSSHIRRAWDGDKLSTITKNSPLCATGAHISIVGHITIDELRARLTRTEAANGFANRFQFPLVRRSKELPFGGSLNHSVTLKFGERLREKIASAQTIGRVEMKEAARAQWATVYSKLSAAQPGLLGAVVARGEAQVVRLALIYALLDGSGQIDVPHLEAALAVWEYCESSAAFVFGDLLGDPVADEIARALQRAGPQGMTRTAIRDLFGRNRSGDRISAALALLATRGRARMETRRTSGHPVEAWVAVAR